MKKILMGAIVAGGLCCGCTTQMTPAQQARVDALVAKVATAAVAALANDGEIDGAEADAIKAALAQAVTDALAARAAEAEAAAKEAAK